MTKRTAASSPARRLGYALAPLLLSAAVASCTGMSASLDQEIVSSIRYDQVPCGELVAQRDALVARHGSPDAPGQPRPGERPRYLGTGLGPVLPDLRSADDKARGRAQGEVQAMNHSLERRKCPGA